MGSTIHTRKMRVGKPTEKLLPPTVYGAVVQAMSRVYGKQFSLRVEAAPAVLYLDEGHQYQIARRQADGSYLLSNAVSMMSEMSVSGHHATRNNAAIGGELPLQAGDWVIDLDKSYGPFTVTVTLVADPALAAAGVELDLLLVSNGLR